MEAIDPFVFRFSIFVLAIFVGYFVVWSVTPALHTPLMSVTNAISSVIVVGALIAVAVSTHPAQHTVHIGIAGSEQLPAGVKVISVPRSYSMETTIKSAFSALDSEHASEVRSAWTSKALGFVALILASVNIFGGFLVTARMLAMYKKKEKK